MKILDLALLLGLTTLAQLSWAKNEATAYTNSFGDCKSLFLQFDYTLNDDGTTPLTSAPYTDDF